MIVGNGLIATALKKSDINFDKYVIFASGVSNSRLEDRSEFEKEFELIKEYLNMDKKFIYFSSIHMLDPSQNKSMYVAHKIKIEKFIEQNFKDYIIYRLPIVIGQGGNAKSLFNFLYDSIRNKKNMNILVDSYRYVIDVEDVVYFVSQTLNITKNTINMVFDKPYNIIDIIKSFENVLNIKAVYDECVGGDFFEVNNTVLKDNLINSQILNEYSNIEYIRKTIKKYYAF